MRLTTKARYAVTAMIDLAIHEDRGPVSLADISECQGISQSYLEQLFARLRREGLVRGTRGPHGGYRLARPADSITIAQIIDAVDENLDATRCNGGENCLDGKACLTHELWSDLSDRIYQFLSGITLTQFAEKSSVRERVAQMDAHRRRGPYSAAVRKTG